MKDKLAKLTGKKIALDVEYDRDSHVWKCGSLTDGRKCWTYTNLTEFLQALRGYKRPCLVGHNLNSDLVHLLRWQADSLPDDFTTADSLLAARLLDSSQISKALKPLAREFGLEYEDESLSNVFNKLIPYCSKDSWSSYWIEEQYRDGAGEYANLLAFTYRLATAFLGLEVAGVALDRFRVLSEKAALELQLSKLIQKLPVGMHVAMLTNDHSLRTWCEANYSSSELAKLDRTESGLLSVAGEQLAQLPRQSTGLANLVAAREIQDFLSLYITRPLTLMSTGGMLHPAYKLLVAKTHRRSTEPAIQNWPATAKSFVVSRFLDGQLISADYNQLEARLFAWQAGCKPLLEAMLSRGYIGVAEDVFGIEHVEKGSPEYVLVKSTVLAVLYNMSPGLLAYRMKIEHNRQLSFSEAEASIDRFFHVYPEIYQEQSRRKAYAWKTGNAWSDVGFAIPLYLLPAEFYPYQEKWLRKKVENKAVNYPTQQLASYVTASALLTIQDELASQAGGWGRYLERLQLASTCNPRSNCGMINIWFPVEEEHDSLLFDASNKSACAHAKEVISATMTTGLLPELTRLCPGFSCPLEVTLTSGPAWAKG